MFQLDQCLDEGLKGQVIIIAESYVVRGITRCYTVSCGLYLMMKEKAEHEPPHGIKFRWKVERDRVAQLARSETALPSRRSPQEVKLATLMIRTFLRA